MIVGLFPGLNSVGGVQLAGRQTAAALTAIARDRQWSVSFLSLNDSAEEHDASVAEIHFRFTGFARNKLRFLSSALWLARKKPKVVFAGHPNLAPIVTLMKTMSPKTRTIIAAHGVEVWRPLPLMRRSALRRADMVTAPSSDTVQKLASIQNVAIGRIQQLPWPLDPEFSRLAENHGRPRPPADFPRGQTVLSVGRWDASERYKGADLLIRAVADLSPEFPDLQLVLVGPGDDVPRLRLLAETLGMGERAHFFAGLSREELAGCYAAADIFALPSTGEGFGLVLLEGMAFGKPVVGAKAGGIPDIIEDRCNGLLIEPTAKALSLALQQLLSDSALRSQLGAQAKEHVEREFTLSQFQKRLLDITSCES